MKILSIESSTKYLSLAVSENGKVLSYRNEILANRLSELLVKRITQLLKKTDCSIDNIDALAVGIGPGSFTSLRVGVSTVKGLSFGGNKPVVGIPSLDILAMNVKKDKVNVCTVSDAKRKMVYLCQYEKNAGKLRKLSDYQLVSIDEVGKIKFTDTIMIGDGIPLVRDLFKGNKGVIGWESEKNWFPQARCLSQLASEKLRTKKYTDAHALKPLYLYAQDCQVRK